MKNELLHVELLKCLKLLSSFYKSEISGAAGRVSDFENQVTEILAGGQNFIWSHRRKSIVKVGFVA